MSVAHWESLIKQNVIYTISIFPELKLWLIRGERFNFYFMYSAAGPSYISRRFIDDRSTGRHFTFQDFLGFGITLGKRRALDMAIKIIHYSNGGTLPDNPGIDVPVVLSVGYTF